MNPTIKRALVSVSDKTGVVDFCRQLSSMGVIIYSTGGTLKTLQDEEIEVHSVSEITGFPEIMDGRVKTLHPKIHGGLLADRNKPNHIEQARANQIELIDLVVVNLYPFKKTVAKRGVSFDEAIENIDIGGPSMLRSAAKNHNSVTVITDRADYALVLEEMRANNGATENSTRFKLALKVFDLTARYDRTITTYLKKIEKARENTDVKTFMGRYEQHELDELGI